MTGPAPVPRRPGAGEPCPCGGGAFGACCGPLLDGAAAPTAESLMRSRYTAFVLDDEDHLFRTWHPRTRPDGPLTSPGMRWTGLEIHEVVGGGEGDAQGVVEFSAHHVEPGHAGAQRERSTFTQRGGRWVYVEAVDGP